MLELVAFGVDDAGDVESSSVSCLTASGSLDDGAAGGGYVVAVDRTAGVIRGASVSGGVCTGAKELATTGVTSETAVAVAPNGQIFAYASSAGIFVCPTTGCSGTQSTTPFVTTTGMLEFGLVFDDSAPPNLYAVGSAGPRSLLGRRPGWDVHADGARHQHRHRRDERHRLDGITSITYRGWRSPAFPSSRAAAAADPVTAQSEQDGTTLSK